MLALFVALAVCFIGCEQKGQISDKIGVVVSILPQAEFVGKEWI